ncbi:MAG: type IV toxin-antitoxin system AbiEi family antitoxin domain-containing protein [Clostridia bacterium]|nr:type IV toxin-antitoxin system AbiEi family antitoxin domain-containing protein [Clostridia bacterium]
MKSRTSVMEELEKKPYGELIMTGKLYREKFSNVMSEAAFAQAISRICRSGEIIRVSKGVYCRPKKTRFGTIFPSERDIIDLFTAGSSGVVVGYGLYNDLGVTTQISKRQTAYSSVSEENLKQIGNITIRKYDLNYTPEIKSVIRIMELLHHHKEIQDINVSAMIRSTERFASEFNEEAFDTVQNIIGYPKWTIAFLREVLDYHRTPNNLSRYLSTLTDYRFPKMEELYETARKPVGLN